MAWCNKKDAGFSLIEVVLACALFGMVVLTFVSTFAFATHSAAQAGRRGRAILFAEEGLEAARSLREQGLSALPAGTYGLVANGTAWALNPTPDVHDVFTRSLTISDVDAHTKKIVSLVTWTGGKAPAATVSLTSELTDWTSMFAGPSPEASLCKPPPPPPKK